MLRAAFRGQKFSRRAVRIAWHPARAEACPQSQNRELVEIVRALQTEREGLLGELGDALQARTRHEWNHVFVCLMFVVMLFSALFLF